MMSSLSNLLYILVALTVLFVLSCTAQLDSPPIPAISPDVNDVSTITDFTIESIKASGGMKAWLAAKQMDVDGVVTFYLPDGSYYLTEQLYEIYPWSNSIQISAIEPQGSFVWQLSQSQFTALRSDKQLKTLPVDIAPRYFAEGIRYITTAPARLFDNSSDFTRDFNPVKIEGRWYYPIEHTAGEGSSIDSYLSKLVLYQNKDTFLVELVWFATTKGKYFMVRGYDYRQLNEGGVGFPAKIEIFESDEKAAVKKRLIKVDFNLPPIAKSIALE
jgi:hypothetical protein